MLQATNLRAPAALATNTSSSGGFAPVTVFMLAKPLSAGDMTCSAQACSARTPAGMNAFNALFSTTNALIAAAGPTYPLLSSAAIPPDENGNPGAMTLYALTLIANVLYPLATPTAPLPALRAIVAMTNAASSAANVAARSAAGSAAVATGVLSRPQQLAAIALNAVQITADLATLTNQFNAPAIAAANAAALAQAQAALAAQQAASAAAQAAATQNAADAQAAAVAAAVAAQAATDAAAAKAASASTNGNSGITATCPYGYNADGTCTAPGAAPAQLASDSTFGIANSTWTYIGLGAAALIGAKLLFGHRS